MVYFKVAADYKTDKIKATNMKKKWYIVTHSRE